MDKAKALKQLQTMESFCNCLLNEIKMFREQIDDSRPKQKRANKRNDRMAQIEAEMEPYFRAQPYMWEIQKKYKLKVPPHYTRVLRYLKTKDPKEFDGLKREWE